LNDWHFILNFDKNRLKIAFHFTISEIILNNFKIISSFQFLLLIFAPLSTAMR